MGKAKRQARKQAKRQREEEAAEAQRTASRRSLFLVVWPALALAGAAGTYYGAESRSTTGIVLLIGVLVWLVVALSGVGNRVRPRDRRAASSIDFGRR